MKFGPPGRPLTVTFATVALLVGVPYLQFKLLGLLAPLLTRLLPPKAFCSPRPTGVLVAPAFAVVPVRAHWSLLVVVLGGVLLPLQVKALAMKCVPDWLPLVFTALPPFVVETLNVFAVRPVERMKYLVRLFNPVGNVPVVEKITWSPATKP
jgi:hypothetical protein